MRAIYSQRHVIVLCTSYLFTVITKCGIMLVAFIYSDVIGYLIYSFAKLLSKLSFLLCLIMIRTETFAKLFFLVNCTGLLMYVVLAFYTIHTAFTTMSQVQKFHDRIQYRPNARVNFAEDTYRDDLKYILLWPVANGTKPFEEIGQSIFINYNCSVVNCYLTSNKYLLNGDYSNFEAIVFNMSEFSTWDDIKVPARRKHRQKYIFYSTVSADSSPLCNLCAESYFNWTWTYKLNSDIKRPLIRVRDKNGIVVAPTDNVKWITDKTVVHNHNYNKTKINTEDKSLKRTVACILEKCEPGNNKTNFALKLQHELRNRSLNLDLFGCSYIKCLKSDCVRIIKNKYYFYLAHEENFAVDYVTTEVIKAYDTGAIPIVLGGADYHKFLPDGSYINGQNTSVEQIATTIKVVLDNTSIYETYHYWRKHYVISESRQYEGICDLCKYLNDKSKFGSRAAFKNFRHWWYSGLQNDKCKIVSDPSERPQLTLNESDLFSYFNILHSNKSFITVNNRLQV